jgi:hypothetical protein
MTTTPATMVACTSTSPPEPPPASWRKATPCARGAMAGAPVPQARDLFPDKASRPIWTPLKSPRLTSITPYVTGRKEQPGD